MADRDLSRYRIMASYILTVRGEQTEGTPRFVRLWANVYSFFPESDIDSTTKW